MKNMRKWNKVMGMLLFAFVLMLTTSTRAEAAKKLKKTDFVFTCGKEKTNFIDVTKNEYDGYMYWFYKTDQYTKGRKSDGTFKMKSGVKLGDSSKKVMKTYGKAKLNNVAKNDPFIRCINYNIPCLDTTKYKTCMQYSCGKYMLRFYFNSKKNLVCTCLIKDPKKYVVNKPIDLGITFKAPSGTKVTTQKMCGKTVYILPKGTVISGNIYEWAMQQYGKDGLQTAASQLEDGNKFKIENAISKCQKYYKNGELVMNYDENDNIKYEYCNPDKLNDYRFFVIQFSDPVTAQWTEPYYIRMK